MDITTYQKKDFIPVFGIIRYYSRVRPLLENAKVGIEKYYMEHSKHVKTVTINEKKLLMLSAPKPKIDTNLESEINILDIQSASYESIVNKNKYIEDYVKSIQREYYNMSNNYEQTLKKVHKLTYIQLISLGTLAIGTIHLIKNWDSIIAYLDKIF